jgi:ferredoxin
MSEAVLLEYAKIESSLRAALAKLFESGEITLAIGYTYASTQYAARAAFIRAPEQAHYSPFCAPNTATLLKLAFREGKKPERIAIVAKGCDSRSIIQLMSENFVERSGLVTLAVPCAGMLDVKKAARALPAVARGTTPPETFANAASFVMRIGGKEYELPREKVLLDKCRFCEQPNAEVYDEFIGEPLARFWETRDAFVELRELEAQSLEQRRAYWQRVFGECVRCHACRAICPLCYCVSCVTEQRKPVWVHKSMTAQENALYHLIRTVHLAGRCTACEECARVCPLELPLANLARKSVKTLWELFGYRAGAALALGNPLLVLEAEKQEGGT